MTQSLPRFVARARRSNSRRSGCGNRTLVVEDEAGMAENVTATRCVASEEWARGWNGIHCRGAARTITSTIKSRRGRRG